MRRLLGGLLIVLLAACARGQAGPDLAAILAERPALNLSDYGLFQGERLDRPAKGVISYDLINPLFSDHAAKDRHLFLPASRQIDYAADGGLSFPVGAVLIKTFAIVPDLSAPDLAQTRIETRLLIHKESGWVAYPYVWNDTGTDAIYRPVGDRRDIHYIGQDGQDIRFTYAIPNQNQCKTCHAINGDIVPIGLRVRHLNHTGPYGVSQLQDWHTRGLLGPVPPDLPALPSYRDVDSPLDMRARAYLDINCAHCHRAGGSASNSGLWLEATEDRPVRLGIGKYPTAAGRGSGTALHIIAPGRSDQSILAYRMASTEAGIAMPELGRALPDEDGLALIRAWIDAMPEPEQTQPARLR